MCGRRPHPGIISATDSPGEVSRQRIPGSHGPAIQSEPQPSAARTLTSRNVRYLIELATEENTLLELEPMSRMVPTTITRMTASITAYSAMS